jgi:nucleotide-binding universal stress UspA family protein
MFGTVLVGTDGSDTAAVAVAHAVELATRTGAELIIASAYRRPPTDTSSPFGPAESWTGDDVARSILDAEEKRFGDRVTLRTVLREGHPADVLIDLAEEERVDLIVVGSKGMSGAKRYVMGSVPNNISHHAPCHVLIVHTTWAEEGSGDVHEARSYSKILVGTDGSESAGNAVALAADLARATGAGLLVVNVGDEAKGRPIVEEAARGIEGVAVETAVVQGDTADALTETASKEGADLIVVGNRGMTGARRFLGSVPNSVSHKAGGNVLIATTT